MPIQSGTHIGPFGLAKALEGDPLPLGISTSPTISRMATQAGVLSVRPLRGGRRLS